jgi:hypothetical protein
MHLKIEVNKGEERGELPEGYDRVRIEADRSK